MDENGDGRAFEKITASVGIQGNARSESNEEEKEEKKEEEATRKTLISHSMYVTIIRQRWTGLYITLSEYICHNNRSYRPYVSATNFRPTRRPRYSSLSAI